MGTFLFLLLLFFVIIPLFKVFWRVWQVQRSFSRMQQQAREAMNNATGNGRQQQQSQRTPKPKKKIDPTMGEYVAFEEVNETTFTSTDDDGSSTFHSESQVEDAVWEEIKN